MGIIKGILTRKRIREGSKIIDLVITPDKKRQVYLEYHLRKKNKKNKIMNISLISEIEVEYDEIAIEKTGIGNTLIINKIKVL